MCVVFWSGNEERRVRAQWVSAAVEAAAVLSHIEYFNRARELNLHVCLCMYCKDYSKVRSNVYHGTAVQYQW